MANAIQFDVIYDDALLADAAATSVRVWFKRYGLLMGSACLVNMAGVAAFLWFVGFRFPLIAVPLIVLVGALGPLYYTWVYFVGPRAYARVLQRMLAGTSRLAVDESKVSITLKSGQLVRRWADLRNIVELPDYFLLLRRPMLIIAIPIPKKGAPEEALQVVREAAKLFKERPV